MVLSDSVHQHWEEFDVAAVQFLTKLVKGEVPSEIIPPVSGPPSFTAFEQ